jgi:hypothetical protein
MDAGDKLDIPKTIIPDKPLQHLFSLLLATAFIHIVLLELLPAAGT